MTGVAEPNQHMAGPRAGHRNMRGVSRHRDVLHKARCLAAADRSTTSLTPYGLTPYGTSFWALILAACGGGGGGGGGGGPTTSGQPSASTATMQPKMVALSGFAYNRPLEGGEVWLDVNGNRQIDAGDYRVPGKVNAKGEYRGQVPEDIAGRPVMVDTTTTAYRGSLPDVLLAPEGSRVVSPITHGLVTGEIKSGDLPEGFNPLTENPYDGSDRGKLSLFTLVRDKLPLISQNLARNNAAIATNQQAIQQLKQELKKLKQDIEALRNPQPKQEVPPPQPGPADPDVPAGPNTPAAPVDAAPTGLEIDVHKDTLDQDRRGQVHLASISIRDDNLGENRLVDLPAGGLLEYRNVTRTGAELWLKANAALHNIAPGAYSYNVALASGLAPDLARTFILTVRDVEHDPVITRLDRNTLSLDETANSTAADTGLRFGVTDADNNLVASPTLSDDRFELRQSGQDWQLWVKPGQIFTSGERIALIITARDATNRTDTQTISFTVADIEHSPDLSIIPAAQQAELSETIGDAVTQRIDTGIAVAVHDADGNLRPLGIERRQADGGWITDNRFEVRNGKLFVKAGQQFDYEHADNPAGAIQLRITASDHAGNSVQRATTIQLTNANDPTTVNSLTINGLVNDETAQIGTPLKAQVDASDPDVATLEYVFAWLHHNDKEPHSYTGSFTPDRPGQYVLTVLIHDEAFKSFKWVEKEFTVPEPVVPISTPPVIPKTGDPNVRFFNTESGVFKNDAYTFSLPETAENYRIIGTVRFGDHADPTMSAGRTLYTLGGEDRHKLRLSSDGLLRLGRDVNLDADGVDGLAELRFTVSAVYFPGYNKDGYGFSYARITARVVIFDLLNPSSANPDAVSPAPPYISIDGDQAIVITETVGGTEHTIAPRPTGISVIIADPNNDLHQTLVESRQGERWQADSRFEVRDGMLFVKAGQRFDYEHADNPAGVIQLRITASDDAGNSVQRTTTIQLTDADEPTTGSVQIVTGTASPRTGQPLTARTQASDDNGITSQWIEWLYQGQPVTTPNGRPVTGESITPDKAGIWQAMLFVVDNHGNKQTFLSDPVTVSDPPPPAPPPQPEPTPEPNSAAATMLTRTIYENHPLTKPIIDLDGVGVFAMAPASDAPDNQFFRVDAATGRIWFVPLDANGDGVRDAGDYPLLDFEDHRDVGGDGTYELQIIRTGNDGTTETYRIDVGVQDLALERTWATRKTVKHESYFYTATQFEQALATRTDLSDAEKAYMKLLAWGSAWAMPREGPLIFTWSLMRQDSPGLIPGLEIDDRHYDHYHALASQALRAWEAVANLKFIEVEDNDHSIGLIRVLVSPSVRGASASRDKILLNPQVKAAEYAHEIGHILGFDHPFYDPKNLPDLFSKDMSEERTLNSIMTYSPSEKQTITQNDINMIQFLYGAPGTDFEGLESLLGALQHDIA